MSELSPRTPPRPAKRARPSIAPKPHKGLVSRPAGSPMSRPRRGSDTKEEAASNPLLRGDNAAVLSLEMPSARDFVREKTPERDGRRATSLLDSPPVSHAASANAKTPPKPRRAGPPPAPVATRRARVLPEFELLWPLPPSPAPFVYSSFEGLSRRRLASGTYGTVYALDLLCASDATEAREHKGGARKREAAACAIAVKAMDQQAPEPQEVRIWSRLTESGCARAHILPLFGAWNVRGVRYYSMPLCVRSLSEDSWRASAGGKAVPRAQLAVEDDSSCETSRSPPFCKTPERLATREVETQAEETDSNSPFARTGGALAFLTSMLEALAFMEQAAVRHRDIRPDNILWAGAGAGWMLADLGVAVDKASEPSLLDIVGNHEYLAPEVGEMGYSFASDMYALGMVLMRNVLPRLARAPADQRMYVERLAARMTDARRENRPQPAPLLFELAESHPTF